MGDHLVTGREVLQPKTLAERQVEARQFIDAFGFSDPSVWSVAVDDPEAGDPFLAAYAAWPTRFYIVDASGVLRYMSEPDAAHEFLLSDFAAALDTHVGQRRD